MPFKEEFISEKELRKRTIISFSVFIIMIAFAVIGWKWLHKQPDDNGTPKPIRKILNYNEGVFSKLYSNNHLAKTYPVSAAVKKVRVNGSDGMSAGFDPSTWKLKVARTPGDTLFITLEEIKALPKTEIVFDFKCIEGWSQVTHWGGVKFSDFAKKYNLSSQTQL
ncbi:MAG TPA: molybdopterin-dependent oxidoreductase, partial [Chitinophagaceae bacterium]|nr:molybdopterin-dependent oxidoreductase [Chitinophagaceae bacterium]